MAVHRSQVSPFREIEGGHVIGNTIFDRVPYVLTPRTSQGVWYRCACWFYSKIHKCIKGTKRCKLRIAERIKVFKNLLLAVVLNTRSEIFETCILVNCCWPSQINIPAPRRETNNQGWIETIVVLNGGTLAVRPTIYGQWQREIITQRFILKTENIFKSS